MEERLGRAVDLARRLAEEAERLRPEPPPAEKDNLEEEYERRVTDVGLRTATRSLFMTEHYAEAVENGVKYLIEIVQRHSGLQGDGVSLTQAALSTRNPILRINRGRSKSDENEQKGYMDLCTGVVSAFRNPRAHGLLKDTPEAALMMLLITNHVVEVVSTATRTRKSKKSP